MMHRSSDEDVKFLASLLATSGNQGQLEDQQLDELTKTPRLTPGDVVLDVNLMIEGFRACSFPKSEGLARTKDAWYILSFLRLIESAVLHEKLWSDKLHPDNLTLKYQDPQNVGIFGGGFGLLWDALNAENVYQSYSGIVSLTDASNYKSRLSFYQTLHNKDLPSLDEYFLDAVTFSETSYVQYLPSTRNLDLYAKFINSHSKKTYQSLIQQANTSLSDGIKKQIEEINKLASSEEIAIPPIAAVVLNKASSLQDVPEILLETRYKFSKVREAFRAYEATLRDSSQTIKHRLKAVNDIQFISKELSKPYDYIDVLQVQEWPDVWSAFSDIAKDGFTADTIIKNVVGKPLEHLSKRVRLRNVQYMFTAKRKALSTPGHMQVLRRLFGNIDEDHIVQVLKSSGTF